MKANLPDNSPVGYMALLKLMLKQFVKTCRYVAHESEASASYIAQD